MLSAALSPQEYEIGVKERLLYESVPRKHLLPTQTMHYSQEIPQKPPKKTVAI